MAKKKPNLNDALAATNTNQIDEFWGKEQEELIHQLLQSKYGRQFANNVSRPSVLTYPLIERFLQAARQGLPLKICCDYCFISCDIFERWRDWHIRLTKRIEPVMQRFHVAQEQGREYKFSKAEQSAIKLNANESLIIEFFGKISLIKSEYALRLMVGLNQSAYSGNVTAAQWLLKQSFPDIYKDGGSGGYANADENEQVNAGYAYIEINAIAPSVISNELTDAKNITPKPTVLNGEVTTTDNVQ